MSAADEAKRLVAAAQESARQLEAAEAEAERVQAERDREDGKQSAEKSFPAILKTIKTRAANGSTFYQLSTNSCGAKNRAYVDRLAELLQKEGFTTKVTAPYVRTPGSGSDSISDTYNSWFQLDVAWD